MVKYRVAKETAPGTQHVLPLSHFSLISSVAHFPHRFIPQWSEAKVLIFFFLLSDHFGISFKFLLLTFPLTATNSAEVHSSQFLHCYCSSHFTFLISIISLEHKKILPNIFVSQVIFLFTTKPHLSEWLI